MVLADVNNCQSMAGTGVNAACGRTRQADSLRTRLQLFLNKIDLFKVKLPKVPLEKYFPEYTGGADVNKAAKYILWRFTQLNRARLSIYHQ